MHEDERAHGSPPSARPQPRGSGESDSRGAARPDRRRRTRSVCVRRHGSLPGLQSGPVETASYPAVIDPEAHQRQRLGQVSRSEAAASDRERSSLVSATSLAALSVLCGRIHHTSSCTRSARRRSCRRAGARLQASDGGSRRRRHLVAFEHRDATPFLAGTIAIDKAWTGGTLLVPYPECGRHTGSLLTSGRPSRSRRRDFSGR